MNERRRLFRDDHLPLSKQLVGDRASRGLVDAVLDVKKVNKDELLHLASKKVEARDTLAAGKLIVVEAAAITKGKALDFNQKASDAQDLLNSSPYSRASPEAISSFYAPNSPILASLVNHKTPGARVEATSTLFSTPPKLPPTSRVGTGRSPLLDRYALHPQAPLPNTPPMSPEQLQQNLRPTLAPAASSASPAELILPNSSPSILPHQWPVAELNSSVVAALREGAAREVVVTRFLLAEWFDACYDDAFSWCSEGGARRFAALKRKTIVFVRHTESTYQALRNSGVAFEAARGLEEYRDAPLTELGKCQAAGLAARLALTGFQPDLVLSSPATRCLQTAALVFPHEFAPPPSPSSPQPQRQRHHAAASPATSPNPASLPPAVSRAIPAAAAVSPPAVAPPATASPKRLACALKVSPLLPETVDSWSDVDQPLAAVVAAWPHLSPFNAPLVKNGPHGGGGVAVSRYHRIKSQSDAALRPKRWHLVTHDSNGTALKQPYPQEPRSNAQLRAALVWRLLSEYGPGLPNVAVFTHSKMVIEDTRPGYRVGLLGPGIEEFRNGDYIMVTFQDD